MEQTEGKEQAANGNHTATTLRPQPTGEPCPTCGVVAGLQPDANGTGTSSYVYALGRVTPRFPRLSVEKEFAQVSGRSDTVGLTDRQVLHTILSQRQNRYLVRQLCWVLTIEGLETYILHPRDPADLDLLVETLRPTPSPLDIDIVIGMRGPIAPPEMCNGLTVPIVIFEQIYSFDRDSLIKAIPRPEKMKASQFEPAALEVFERIQQIADNAGATDEHRTLNYCAVRYPAIYTTAADCYARNFSLAAVEVRPSRLSGIRKVVDIIFSYAHRQTDVTEKYFCRLDVSEEFPFLVTKILPYYDR